MQVIKRHWAIISVTSGLVVLFLFLYAFRDVLFPFLLGFLLVYLLMPMITWVERKTCIGYNHRQARRILLILLIYIVVIALAGFLVYYTITVLMSAISGIHNPLGHITKAVDMVQEWLSSFRYNIPPQFQAQVDQALSDAGTALGNATKETLLRGLTLIPSSIGFVFALVILPIFLFYLLKDWEKLGQGFYSFLPAGIVEHVRRVSAIIENTVGRYFRVQALLGLVIGFFDLIGFLIIGVEYAPLLAFLIGAGVMIPTVGALIGGGSALIITVATAPEKLVWVFVVYVVGKVLEDYIIGPKLQGASLNVHPAIILILLTFGTSVAGFWGTLFIVPLAAGVAEMYKYIRKVTAPPATRSGPTDKQPSA